MMNTLMNRILCRSGIAAAALTLSLSALNAAENLKILSPENNAVVSLLSPEQKGYLSMPRAERIIRFADSAKRKEMQSYGYYPQTVRLRWEGPGVQKRLTAYTVTVTRLPDKTPFLTVSTGANELILNNLEIAREYEWTVALADRAEVPKLTARFRTEDRAPRLLRIDGVPNVRDLGGRIGMDGRRVKQSRVFRTAGLNDNASTIYTTREEVLANDTDGRAARTEAVLKAELARFQELQKTPAQLNLVDVPLSRSWTVFRPAKAKFTPADEDALCGMTAIPAEFLGAKAEQFTADADGKIQFTGKAQGPAVLMQIVESGTDGWLALGCGADWFWDVRVNGAKVFERRLQGNGKHPINAANYVFPVPVKSGRNLLCVVLETGSDSWTWYSQTDRTEPAAKLIRTRIANLESTLKAIFHLPNGIKPGKNRLNAAMKEYMLKYLGVRSDIDLRSDKECYGMTGSPLGETVTWFHYSAQQYAGMQTQEGKEAFSKSFRVFLDEKNYPIVFHCIAGQDRTGAVAFILNGLLGVPEEQLYLDWETTGFWNPNSGFNHKNLFNRLVRGFDQYPGSTVNQRIEQYVLSCGFTPADIAHFRSLMLE